MMFHFNLHHITLILIGYLSNISCSPLLFVLLRSSQVSGNRITFSHVELPSCMLQENQIKSISQLSQFVIFPYIQRLKDKYRPHKQKCKSLISCQFLLIINVITVRQDFSVRNYCGIPQKKLFKRISKIK